MALLATAEQKEKKKIEKENKKFEQLVKKYHLTDLGTDDFELIKNICYDLSGTNLMELGLALSFSTKAEDRVIINRLSAMQEQNWIIINQLGRLNKKLDKLINCYNKKDSLK